eukprot:COSAG05_NODE_11101_length_531_cov_0.532407_1_plen_27_part_01
MEKAVEALSICRAFAIRASRNGRTCFR